MKGGVLLTALSMALKRRAACQRYLRPCLFSFSPQASATHFYTSGTPGITGTNNGVWRLPSATMTVKPVLVSSNYYGGLVNALQDEYVPTDLVVQTGTDEPPPGYKCQRAANSHIASGCSTAGRRRRVSTATSLISKPASWAVT